MYGYLVVWFLAGAGPAVHYHRSRWKASMSAAHIRDKGGWAKVVTIRGRGARHAKS